MDLKNNEVFPKGDRISEPTSQYFVGEAYLYMLSVRDDQWNCPIGNVTFEPGCRNNWHKHPGGQILLVTDGNGWYQEDGTAPQKLSPGDVVKIPPNVKHWHGATKDSFLVHLSIETNASAGAAQWLEPVSEIEYNKL